MLKRAPRSHIHVSSLYFTVEREYFWRNWDTEGKTRGDARYINTDAGDHTTALSECASSSV